ncbi:unnamed protein product [Effrenium voratum]|nr:unnamed protein product [Effrenium voratum]
MLGRAMVLLGSAWALYRPGTAEPEILDLGLTEAEVEDILANCPEDAPEWYFIPMLQESDTDVSRYPLEVRRQLSKLGSYIFGPSTIYSEKCPLYVHEENATQRHHENMKDLMEMRFGWLLQRVEAQLARAVAPEPIEWMSYPYLKMHRGDCLDDLPQQFRKLALQVAPPHRDMQYTIYLENKQQDAQTLTFTLPIKVPSGGAGLRMFEAWMDKKIQRLVGQKARGWPPAGWSGW